MEVRGSLKISQGEDGESSQSFEASFRAGVNGFCAVLDCMCDETRDPKGVSRKLDVDLYDGILDTGSSLGWLKDGDGLSLGGSGMTRRFS